MALDCLSPPRTTHQQALTVTPKIAANVFNSQSPTPRARVSMRAIGIAGEIQPGELAFRGELARRPLPFLAEIPDARATDISGITHKCPCVYPLFWPTMCAVAHNQHFSSTMPKIAA